MTQSSALTFTSTLGELRSRLDVAYIAKTERLDAEHTSAYPLVPLGDIAEVVQYGTSVLSRSEAVGSPVLRMNNLGEDGLDVTDLKYAEVSPRDVQRYRLQGGDILIIRTNGSKDLVGRSEVFDLEGEWLFASYLIRVRVRRDVADPRYISHFLNTEAGRGQITRSSRQILMTNINSSELRSVRIPLPSVSVQRQLAADLDRARAARAELQQRGDRLLAGLPQRLLDILGIRVTPTHVTSNWVTKLDVLRMVGRLDSGAGHPTRAAAIEAVRTAAGDRMSAQPVGEIASVVRGAIRRGASPFVGLGDIESNTGILDPTTEWATGDGLAYQEGDVLYGRLRPYLNKVMLARGSGTCSPEFIILRPLTDRVDAAYLADILRTKVVVDQARHLVTGNTLPRVSASDVSNILVPVPSIPAQRELSEGLETDRAAAVGLRIRAASTWAQEREVFVSAVMRGATE